jgi:hypothetical protein
MESLENSNEKAEPKEEVLNRHPRRDLDWYRKVTQKQHPFQEDSGELVIDIDDMSIENNEDSLELITIKDEKR